LIPEMLDRTSVLPITSSESRKATSTKPRFAPVVGRATTFKERDNPTEGAGKNDQSALEDRVVQRHPESGDKRTRGINIRT